MRPCVTPKVCIIGGDTRLMRTTDGGSIWLYDPLQRPLLNPISVACTSMHRCILAANGYIYTTTLSSSPGYVWKTVERGQNWLSPISASCNLSGSCSVTLGADPGHILIGIGSNGGESWTLRSFGNNVVASSAACWDGKSCLVALSDDEYLPGGELSSVFGTVNGGKVWKSLFTQDDIPTLSSVDCPTSSACFATGDDSADGYAESSSTAGRTWNLLPTVTGTSSITSVSCVSASVCFGATVTGGAPAGLLVTRNSGSSWTNAGLPSGAKPLSITCTSSSSCFAIQPRAPQLLVTLNAGTSWVAASLPSAVLQGDQLFSLACPSVTECVATASEDGRPSFLSSSDGGREWTTSMTLSGTKYWYASNVSCSSTVDCTSIASWAIYGGDGGTQPYTTSNGGVSWMAVTALSDQIEAVNALQCTSDGTCRATASDWNTYGPSTELTSTDGGSHWATSTMPLAEVTSMTCRSATACVATGIDLNGGTAIAQLT